MRNARSGHNVVRTGDTDLVTNLIRAGWNDMMAQRPRPKSYETAPELAQRNYEIGRSLGAVALSTERRPVVWPVQMSFNDLVNNGLIRHETYEQVVAENKWHLKGQKQ